MPGLANQELGDEVKGRMRVSKKGMRESARARARTHTHTHTHTHNPGNQFSEAMRVARMGFDYQFTDINNRWAVLKGSTSETFSSARENIRGFRHL